MVNYCCVDGCGRNSRIHNHLNFYSLPKEKDRQLQWLEAAGREDLLNKEDSNSTGVLNSYNRFCSRHFPPSCIKKNRRLVADAVPSLCLPGNSDEDSYKDPLTHTDIICNSCANPVVGFRYKCVTCSDYDLCQKCEMMEVHPQHYVLRIPKPLKYKFADNLVKKWLQFFKHEHISPDTLEGASTDNDSDDESSDDEPITKYARNYDSGIELSEDVKEKIRKEVKRVINLKPEELAKITATKTKQIRKRNAEPAEKCDQNAKRMKVEEEDRHSHLQMMAPEVVFADVNDVNTPLMDVKPKTINLTTSSVMLTEILPTLPMQHLVGMLATQTHDGSSQVHHAQPSEVYHAPPSEVHLAPSSQVLLPPSSQVQLAQPSEVHHMTPPSNFVSMQKVNLRTLSEMQNSGNLSNILQEAVHDVPIVNLPTPEQPVMHVKLSDDLTELMIEVTSNNQKTFYKYSDTT